MMNKIDMSRGIKNHKALREKILYVERLKNEQELALFAGLKETMSVVSDPVPFVKEVTRNLAKDKDFRKDLLRLALSAGVNYLGRWVQSPGSQSAIASLFESKNDTGEKSGNILKRILQFLSSPEPDKD